MALGLNNTTDSSNATTSNWLCEDHPEGVIFWSCVIIVSFVVEFPGTVVVLLDIFQKRRKGTSFTPNDVFMLNLIVLDLLHSVLILPDLYNLPSMYDTFIPFLFSFNLCGRPLFITCICLDCYLAVVHPVTYRARKSLTPRVLMAVGVWTVTVVAGINFVVRRNDGFANLSPIWVFALTLPVIGFCDFSILWTLKRSKLGGKDISPQKKKAMKTIINSFLIIFTSYFPPIIATMLSLFPSLDETTHYCLVLIPVMSITFIGNTVSLILQLIKLRKLDWLKCWEHK